MNCSEVMELMQRRLDGDINDTEQRLLTEHINHCPACSEMAERLERLHMELVQLPKVEPKFSLVDAIMPTLDFIDRDEQLAAVESNVEPYPHEMKAVSPVTNDKSEKERIDKDRSQPQAAQRWFERIRWRATSAVVAAGLVLGLFIVNFKPPTVEQAGDFGELGKEQLMQSEAMDESHGPQETKSDSSSPVKEKPANNDPQNNQPDSSAYKAPDGTENKDLKASEQGVQEYKAGSADRESSKTEADSKGKSSRRQKEREIASTDQPPVKGGQPKTDLDKGKVPAKQEGKKEDAKKDQLQKDTKQTPAEEPPKEDTNQVQNDNGSTEEKQVNSLVGPPSITSTAEATAPNGSLMATWDNGQLLLYKLTGQERTKLQTIALADKPIELLWSADSSKLTIVTAAEDGKSVKQQYELKNESLELVKDTENQEEREVIEGSVQQQQ
ncbi:zf-HC2 domain-containing protein [Paenibacillus sp. B1-33]|uniref:anti-sigma factor family protein n=1 Tax=unclassified Paenibacillus TaxID=185978 RepID=UPI003D2E2660